MTVTYNWLKDYLECDLSPENIAVILTDIGLEVDKFEKVESVRGGLEGVVVGHVLSCEKHADADKLKVTRVDVGSGEPLQIVCGAPNVAQGQKVLVATVNTTLWPTDAAEGFKIKRSKIRGVESLGMICAEDELGIGKSHDGIMVLEQEATVGTPARDYLSIEDDYIYELGLTPNRVDAASHFGVARDLHAYLSAHGIPSKLRLPEVVDFAADEQSEVIDIQVDDVEKCPRYAGVTVSGLTLAPSPEWMQKRLRAIGINPKNNLVDITNYVLHETGQPLHAFDTTTVKGRKIVVRTCGEGTPFITLDEVERKLSAEDLMICNAEEPMCIAGVMGGRNSGISDTTTDVFIESAYFAPSTVRRTARRHGLSTDSSFRFERGADPNMTIYALKRAAMLMKELGCGRISMDIKDVYSDKVEPFRFEVSLSRICALIGKDVPAAELRGIIDALGIEIEDEHGDRIQVSVPPFRVDVYREADLAEEILRIYGYNNIEIPVKVNSSISGFPKPDPRRIKNTISDLLAANGFREIMSNSLTKSSYYSSSETFKEENCVRILNPLSSDLNVMRQTLLFNALEAVELNTNRRNPNLRLFEFGNCYSYRPEQGTDNPLAAYRESMKIGITITGAVTETSWNASERKSDYFYIRGWAEKLLSRFGADIYSYNSEPAPADIYAEGLALTSGDKAVITLGKVSPQITAIFDLKSEVYYMEIDFAAMVKLAARQRVEFRELPKYPEVKRDLALLVDKEVTFARLRETALKTERKLLKQVSLFDVYEGDKLPAGKKSYAMSFILQDETKTLTDNVIDKTMKNLADRLSAECGAEIRS